MESLAISTALSFVSNSNVASAVAASVTMLLFTRITQSLLGCYMLAAAVHWLPLGPWVTLSSFGWNNRGGAASYPLLENSEAAEKLFPNSNSLSEPQGEPADTKRQLALVTDEQQASVTLTNSLIDDDAPWAHSLGHARIQIMELDRTLEESEGTISVPGYRLAGFMGNSRRAPHAALDPTLGVWPGPRCFGYADYL